MRSIDIIPKPRSLEPNSGVFALDRSVTFDVDPSAARAVEALRVVIRDIATPVSDGGGATIRVAVHPDPERPSGYTLDVTPDHIDIVGADPAGAFYAVQTLRQLLPPYQPTPDHSSIPCVSIADHPQLRWRGLMIDVARHFFPVDFLMRLIDLMAMHKLNVLHLHLTDDQGWRVEVPAYPKLTEIGAWRMETVVGNDHGIGPVPGYTGVPHGGFYTRDEMRQIIDYAAERFIDVVPEIDMPGHIQSAIAAYPHLGLASEPVEVRRRWGISDHVLRLDDASLEFCQAVWSEVVDLFPGEFVHLGGDEVPKHRWVSSPDVRQRIRDLGLPDVKALQPWFTREMAVYLAQQGRRLVGWDEILEGGELPSEVVVMAWRDEQMGIHGASLGHEVVMAPKSHTYLDYYQSENVQAEPLAFPRLTSLETVYSYEPVPTVMVEDGTSTQVLGAQAQLWTAYVPDQTHADYMLFPRLSAFAEAVWREPFSQIEFSDFRERLKSMLARLEGLGVAYRPLDEDPFELDLQTQNQTSGPAEVQQAPRA